MARVQVEVVHAFVDGGQGGNPAGVVLDGDALSPEQRQRVAALVGLSETAFVGRSERADILLSFHTPSRAIPHCGHATVATFARLWELGRLSGALATNDTVDGVRRIHREGSAIFMEQVVPRLRTLPERGAAALPGVLASLGLRPEQLSPGRGPQLAHNGNGCLLVPLREEQALPALRPDMDAIARISEAEGLVGFYVFAPTPGGPRHAEVRMFAPAYGIPEEAATGMMAGPLGHWLGRVLGVPGEDFLIGQGRYMTPPSPSLLRVDLRAEGPRVGGEARLVRRLEVDL